MTIKRKGIILAGGHATRLHPLTLAVSKQLLPVYDKPCIYYPLSTLLLAGIKEVMIITNPEHIAAYMRLLGGGDQFGIDISYMEQPKPEGLPQAYLLAENWLDGCASAMMLGDNIHHGTHFGMVLKAAMERREATIFGAFVGNPERFGVPRFRNNDVKTGDVLEVVEKPKIPPSPYAITGLYFLPPDAPARTKALQPSARGELEISHLLNSYCGSYARGTDINLYFEDLGRGFSWHDIGSIQSLHLASVYVQVIQSQQRISIGDPLEVAYRNGWITAEDYAKRSTGCYPVTFSK